MKVWVIVMAKVTAPLSITMMRMMRRPIRLNIGLLSISSASRFFIIIYCFRSNSFQYRWSMPYLPSHLAKL
ncbi:Uncharacterised protein [Vibrio cholerae]|nr:Uncharacterised protein [Vibrio cholerae]CSD17186.1 Uncharacterised protein [Vibrio cholerae]CSI30936.1 Uncharacterised protein [Vibrio cholerae]CSI55126.1 Uncharacterised protein [Vibrio cholerae]